MKNNRRSRRKDSEAGVALLIAIFVLLLISTVAISMIVASGREGSLAGNYRSSSSAYYSALAGLEEGRGRLLPTNVNYLGAGFFPSGTIPVGTVRYITNPTGGENVLTAYPDNEYQQEFGVGVSGAVTTSSVSGVNGSNLPGPSYKWVRFNPVTEKSLGIDVNNDGTQIPVTPLFYDEALNPPSLTLTQTSTAYQALEVTSFAVLTNHSEKMTQYLVTPVNFNLNFPSAITLDGNGVQFSGGSSANWQADGIDQQGGGPTCGSVQNPVPSIGYSHAGDASGSSFPKPSNYLGSSLVPPASNNTSGPSTAVNISSALSSDPAYQYMQTPATLDALVQTITQNANAVLTGPAGPGSAGWPSGMSSSNPQTVVVNGDYSMSGNFTGYGILVVTGNFTATGTTGWNGIVLIIGEGTASVKGTVQMNGAVLVANTKNSSGVELASLGPASYQVSGGGNGGTYYNSCLIGSSQPTTTYKVLSFREIAYTD